MSGHCFVSQLTVKFNIGIISTYLPNLGTKVYLLNPQGPNRHNTKFQKPKVYFALKKKKKSSYLKKNISHIQGSHFAIIQKNPCFAIFLNKSVMATICFNVSNTSFFFFFYEWLNELQYYLKIKPKNL